MIVITLIQPTLSGKIRIGLFISLVNAVFSLTSQMSWGLSRNIDALVKGNEFCRDMRDFWNLEEEEGILETPKYMNEIKEIEIIPEIPKHDSGKDGYFSYSPAWFGKDCGPRSRVERRKNRGAGKP